ncbi:uncharacterized protein N7511_011515 [Penicillium nucicola]|uniref:uncharacterized protein n=1 Tax=Penicillium nucicola TaxID=1850975 RepID=UPI0025450A33|nr:uncharacterized protein N7511_011515 [Penicillium nucicola]KAJ5742496.1 hypothetical protein N7511_011515 [Penicillium nucicola]
MTGRSALEFGKLCEIIGVLFNMTIGESGTQYLNTRRFTELHQVLLPINQKVFLQDYLRSLKRDDLGTLKNCTDTRGRTPLMWAVEFGWSAATQILLDYGADPHQATATKRGSSTLLHLAIAGPRSQFSRAGFLEVIDHLLQIHPALDWSVLTDDNMSVDALSPVEQFSDVALVRIYQS